MDWWSATWNVLRGGWLVCTAAWAHLEGLGLPVDLLDLGTNPILAHANAESTLQSSPLNLACLVAPFFRNLLPSRVLQWYCHLNSGVGPGLWRPPSVGG